MLYKCDYDNLNKVDVLKLYIIIEKEECYLFFLINCLFVLYLNRLINSVM